MTLELPEGITYNNSVSREIELDFIEEVINSTKCNQCDLHLRASLVTINNRHEGTIIMVPSGNILWKNALPKDRVRCIKLIDEALVAKFDKHKERHKND